MKPFLHSLFFRLSHVTLAVSLGASALIPAAAYAESAADYPSQVVKIVVPVPVGGPNDVIARAIAGRLRQVLNANVIVDSRPGAGGLMGVRHAALAKPDGYTLLLSYPAPLAVNLTPDNPKGVLDLATIEPIAMVAEIEGVFAVHPSVPATDLKSFISYVRAKKGDAKLAIAAPGNFPALASEQFFAEQDLQAIWVNYQGGAPALKDLLGGHFDGAAFGLTGVAPLIRSGKLRALAITTPERSPYVPDVPTTAEQGFPNFRASVWFVLAAPAGTPRPIIDKLNAAVNSITRSDEFKETMKALDGVPRSSTPEQAQKFLVAEQLRGTKLVEALAKSK